MTTAFQASAFQNNAFQIDNAAVLPTGGGVPGRTLYPRPLDDRPRYESDADKFSRRVREGTLPAPLPDAELADPGAEYARKSARLAAGIARFRAEAQTARQAIAALEVEQASREAAQFAHDMLLLQQALQLAQVREAVLLEEIEVVDIAYVAYVVMGATLQ